MTNYKISSPKNSKQATAARDFCLAQIKAEYGYDYNPEWHADIDSLGKPDSLYNNIAGGLFLTVKSDNKIIATGAMRNLTSKPALLQMCVNQLGEFKFASLWRVYTDSHYRNLGLATDLVKRLEKSASSFHYNYIYLHTSWNKPASVKFWQNRGYKIIAEDENSDRTVHMVKRVGSD